MYIEKSKKAYEKKIRKIIEKWVDETNDNDYHYHIKSITCKTV